LNLQLQHQLLTSLISLSKIRPSGCVEYVGKKKSGNYGYIRVPELHKSYITSRLMYELTFGSIPEGLNVLHKCDNPPCLNPMHLFLGTQQDNVKDAVNKGRFQGKGELNSYAILTWDKVKEIRAECKKGWSYESIARQYGVSGACIRKIIHNETWKE